MDDKVIATVCAATGRRIFGVSSLAVLGLLLIYLGFARPPALAGQIFLLLMGGVSLWLSDKMRKATAFVIEMTDTELRDSSGTIICKVEDIIAIDRGFFAFKPSNGFLIKTKNQGARIWRPGLWWRMGQRIGIGGMTPGRQTKFMSELIAASIAEREIHT